MRRVLPKVPIPRLDAPPSRDLSCLEDLKFMCPRCGGNIPNNESPGAYPGALSRLDNCTEICSACGHAEALESHLTASGCMKKEEWFINKIDEYKRDVAELKFAELVASKSYSMSPEHIHTFVPMDCEDCEIDEIVCSALICTSCSEILESEGHH